MSVSGLLPRRGHRPPSNAIGPTPGNVEGDVFDRPRVFMRPERSIILGVPRRPFSEWGSGAGRSRSNDRDVREMDRGDEITHG
jgi:hypothetical protein